MELLPGMKELAIMADTLAQLQTVARLVAERFDGSECGGFLGRDPKSHIIDTAILGTNQRVSPTHVTLDGQSVLAAGRELQQRGKMACGWWHSHGRLQPFHSAIDDATTRDILIQLSHSNRIYIEESLHFNVESDTGRVSFWNDQEDVVELCLEPALAAQFAQTPLTAKRKTPIALAYSLVVNAQGTTPHAELYLRTWNSHSQSFQPTRQVVPVQIISTQDEALLLAEIETKVKPASAAWRGPMNVKGSLPDANLNRYETRTERLWSLSPAALFQRASEKSNER